MDKLREPSNAIYLCWRDRHPKTHVQEGVPDAGVLPRVMIARTHLRSLGRNTDGGAWPSATSPERPDDEFASAVALSFFSDMTSVSTSTGRENTRSIKI